MSRRDNGLPGSGWQRLADIAPPLADQLLDALRDEGIPAWAEPAIPVRGAFADEQLERPTDRVRVPGPDVVRARAVLERLLPDLQAELGTDAPTAVATDEEVWAGIIASYSAPPADPVGRWSVAEDLEERGGRTSASTGAFETADEVAAAGDGPATGGFEDIRAELDALAATSPAASGPAEDPTDHFVPPPPPPLPTGDPVTRAAWVGLIGGPLFLVLATILGWGPGGLVGFLAVIAFVGGFVTLVTRMRDDSPDDDGDNGAVV